MWGRGSHSTAASQSPPPHSIPTVPSNSSGGSTPPQLSTSVNLGEEKEEPEHNQEKRSGRLSLRPHWQITTGLRAPMSPTQALDSDPRMVKRRGQGYHGAHLPSNSNSRAHRPLPVHKAAISVEVTTTKTHQHLSSIPVQNPIGYLML